MYLIQILHQIHQLSISICLIFEIGAMKHEHGHRHWTRHRHAVAANNLKNHIVQCNHVLASCGCRTRGTHL